MVRWESLKRGLRQAIHSLLLMVAGAWLLAQYLDWNDLAFRHSSERMQDSLTLAFWLCFVVSTLLRPKEERIRQPLKEPSPRWSGVSVVLITGLAAAFFVATSSKENGYELTAIIVLGTLAIAVLVWRFASAHAGDIGEVRFGSKTTGGLMADGS